MSACRRTPRICSRWFAGACGTTRSRRKKQRLNTASTRSSRSAARARQSHPFRYVVREARARGRQRRVGYLRRGGPRTCYLVCIPFSSSFLQVLRRIQTPILAGDQHAARRIPVQRRAQAQPRRCPRELPHHARAGPSRLRALLRPRRHTYPSTGEPTTPISYPFHLVLTSLATPKLLQAKCIATAGRLKEVDVTHRLRVLHLTGGRKRAEHDEQGHGGDGDAAAAVANSATAAPRPLSSPCTSNGR